MVDSHNARVHSKEETETNMICFTTRVLNIQICKGFLDARLNLMNKFMEGMWFNPVALKVTLAIDLEYCQGALACWRIARRNACLWTRSWSLIFVFMFTDTIQTGHSSKASSRVCYVLWYLDLLRVWCRDTLGSLQFGTCSDTYTP